MGEGLSVHLKFTPAERVVMKEQAEALRLELAGLIADLETVSPTPAVEIVDQWVKCLPKVDYLADLVRRKIESAIYAEIGKEAQ